MENEAIKNLREALSFSPDNIPLRLHLAQSLMDINLLDEAEIEYQHVLSIKDSTKAKTGLAQIFFQRKEFSKCNVVLEGLINSSQGNFDIFLLHTKALVEENNIQDAIETYKKVIAIDPAYVNEALDSKLRLLTSSDIMDDIDELEEQYIQRPKINFSHVGGMEDIKKEIDLKIIQPLKHPEIYKAYGKKIGGGILLYGPPGCGKTYIAKATAGQVNAKFISVSLNDILDMWIGSSEKNLHEIFEMARSNTPCVLFFDEIDALGASRSDMKQSAGRHLINQFLQELDGVDNDNEGVLILGATNTPWHLDAAFRRPGRFDRIIFVPPPDALARELILKLKLNDKPKEGIDYTQLANKTKEFSGADIEAIIDIAIESKLEDALRDGIPKPLTTKDLKGAIKKHKASTQEWFVAAKNFALYANQSGLYDDILSYMGLKK